MVKPTQRKEMALQAVIIKAVSIRLACQDFCISEICYRYQPKKLEDNVLIADWLIRLCHNQTDWGLGNVLIIYGM